MGSHVWGESEELIRNEQYVVKRLTIKAGHEIPWHFHRTKHETMLCESGRGHVQIASYDTTREQLLNGGGFISANRYFAPGSIVEIPTQQWHRVRANDGDGRPLVLAEPQGSNTDDIEWLVDA